MPTITAYPTSVALANNFTNAGNVVGNTTSYATHNGIRAVEAVISADYYFDLSAVPAAAVVDRIRFNVTAKANAANRRLAKWVDVQHSTGGGLNATSTPGVTLQSTDTTVAIVLDRTVDAGLWGQLNMSTSVVRDPTTSWGFGFESTIASSTLTSWQKFWLEVDYTLPVAGADPLILLGVC